MYLSRFIPAFTALSLAVLLSCLIHFGCNNSDNLDCSIAKITSWFILAGFSVVRLSATITGPKPGWKKLILIAGLYFLFIHLIGGPTQRTSMMLPYIQHPFLQIAVIITGVEILALTAQKKSTSHAILFRYILHQILPALLLTAIFLAYRNYYCSQSVEDLYYVSMCNGTGYEGKFIPIFYLLIKLAAPIFRYPGKWATLLSTFALYMLILGYYSYVFTRTFIGSPTFHLSILVIVIELLWPRYPKAVSQLSESAEVKNTKTSA